MVWGTAGELLAFRRFPFLYIILFSGRFNNLFRYRFKLFEAFERAELAAKSRRPMYVADIPRRVLACLTDPDIVAFVRYQRADMPKHYVHALIYRRVGENISAF